MAGSLKASPRSSALGAISDFVRKLRDKGNEYEVKKYIPLLGGTGIGDLLIGQTPEELNEWSYGNYPLQMAPRGTGSLIPQMKRGRAQQVLDTAFSAGDAAGLAKLGPKAAKALLNRMAETSVSPLAQVGAIKPRGGNWLPEGLPNGVNPAEALQPYIPGGGRSREELLKVYGPYPTEEAIRGVDNAKIIDKWVQGPLRKYIMRDMATPEDPIRRLADEGILHVDPQELNYNLANHAKWPLDNQTFHAKSDMAKAWEGVADNAVGANQRVYLSPEPGSSRLSREHPWIDKLPEDEYLYSISDPQNFANDVGFDRLISSTYDDLLSGALRPEQLQSGSFSVEAAVRMAHNKRMAEQAAKEAELLKNSRNAATHTFKEYPGPDNPEGFHWVQIKPTGVKKLPEGYTVEPNSTYLGKTGYQLRMPDGSRLGLPQETEELAFAELKDPRYLKDSDLQKALSHEGDVMGHCVGDYCDQVAEGTTGIFSLRDKGGKSHVTIETGKSVPNKEPLQIYEELPPELKMELYNRHGPESELGFSERIWTDPKMRAYVAENYPSSQTIRQIKGSGKKDPTQAILKEDLPKYQPYLKDFLNSQSWSNVRDLKNTGLIDAHDLYGPEASQFRFLTPEEQATLHEANPNLKSKMAKELDDPNFNAGWEPDEQIEFAQGGMVRHPDHFENLDLFLGRQQP